MPLIAVYARLVVDVSEPRRRFLFDGDEGELANFQNDLRVRLARPVRVLDIADLSVDDKRA